MDGGATAWNVVETSTPGVYTIENGGNYLAGNGFNVNIKTVTNANDAAAQWKLISKKDALDAAGEGTLMEPSNATVLIKNPEIKRNASTSWYPTWTITNYAGDGNPGNFAQGGGSAVANCAESYMSNNGFKATQTITEGVKAGVYRLDAQAFYQQRGSNANVPSIYLNDQSAVLPFNSAKSGSMAGAYTDMLANKWPTEPLYVRVEDGGSLTITVSSGVSSCWTIFGEMSLTYYGDCTVVEAQNAGIVKEWNEYVAAKDEIANTLDEAGKSAYNTAKASIETPTSVEALATAKDALDAAYVAAVKAQTTPGVDMTAAIVNPNFDGNINGWTDTFTGKLNHGYQDNNTYGPIVQFMECWAGQWSGAATPYTLPNGKLYQTVDLPQGIYTLSADIIATQQEVGKNGYIASLDQVTGIYIYANSNELYKSDACNATGAAPKNYNFTFYTTGGDTEIGLLIDGTNCNWVAMDNVRLTFNGQDFPALPETVTGKMNAEIAAAQTTTVEEYNANKSINTYNAAVAAITAAQASKVHYDAAGLALAAQKALIEGTNVYAAEGFTAFQDNWSTLNEKYENNTLTNEDGVVNPTIATGWHASTAYNFLLIPWTIAGEACNEFAKSLYINTWSTEGNTDGSNFTVPFFEYWIGDAEKLGDNTIATSVTGLENGLYSATAWVRVRATNGVTATDATGINLVAGDGNYTGAEGNGTVDATEGAQIGESQFTLAEVTAYGLVKDGTLNISLNVKDANISWLSFKNVKYTKVRDLTPEEAIVYATTEEIAALNAAIEAAEANTIGFAQDEYAPYNNIDAIATLKAAQAIDTTNPVAEETVVEAIDALNNVTWTANTEEVNAVYDGGFSLTTAQSGGYLVPTGWTNLGYNTRVYNQTNKGSNNGVDAGSEGGCLFAKFTTTYGEVEGYEMPLKAGNYTLKFIYGGWNEVGTRDIKVYSAADNSVAATVTPNSVTAKNNQAHVSTDAWTSYDGIIEIPADGNYILSFYRSGSTQNQIAISDLAIFSISEAELAKRELLPEIESYKVPTTNIGDEAFQYPADGINDVNSIIEAAQNVYDNEGATLEEVNEAIQNMKDLTNPTLNAPADGQKFNVVLTYEGYAQNNKAITYIANGRNDAGKYNIQYLAEVNPNYAQAFTMTQVEGNKYKMSQIDNDGVERYISTGAPYGGDNRQIRTTTNPDDALIVQVIPTATEGVYNLKNTFATGDNTFIGSQDAGVYTVNSHYDFKIVEATEAAATLKITDAKYGTFIAPFDVDAEIPEGVTVYTVSANNDNVLTLEPADAIKANTAYVVSAEEAVTKDLSGWGLATKDSYTTDLLTGTYIQITDVPLNKYLLQNQNGTVGFYKVTDQNLKLGANRCYLDLESAGVKAFFFDEETAIKAIDALTSGKAEIYDMNGRKLNKMQKGINIVNGVKVLVK